MNSAEAIYLFKLLTLEFTFFVSSKTLTDSKLNSWLNTTCLND